MFNKCQKKITCKTLINAKIPSVDCMRQYYTMTVSRHIHDILKFIDINAPLVQVADEIFEINNNKKCHFTGSKKLSV